MKSYKSKLKLHEPVLKSEVIKALKVDKIAHLKKRPVFIDATLGLGGHTEEILNKGGNVVGIEADEEMLEVARKKLEVYSHMGQVKFFQGNFRDIDKIAEIAGFDKVDGILFDLGVASPQLISPWRGFSFQTPDAPLDMRIDKSTQRLTAADLLALLSERQLRTLFAEVLNRSQAQKIAASIVEKRVVLPIKKVEDFLAIVGKFKEKRSRLHPATKALLALRIAVNSEIDNLKVVLPKAFYLLVPSGRLAIISFHSGEDLVVKRFFQEKEIKGEGKIISKEPISPKEKEIKMNPRARSAKMRIIEKI